MGTIPKVQTEKVIKEIHENSGSDAENQDPMDMYKEFDNHDFAIMHVDKNRV